MNYESEQLIIYLLLLEKGQITAEYFKEKLNPNYSDINGNNCFHFLAEYSFEQFYIKNIKTDINLNSEIINEQSYNEKKALYKKQIHYFTEFLLKLNCDILKINKNKQNPLIYSIIKNNYVISKEYFDIQKNLELFKDKNYYQLILNNLFIYGKATDTDCLELMLNFVTLINKNKELIINRSILNQEIKEIKLTPIVCLCKNFGENIYEKYNDILKLKSIDYLKNNNSGLINMNFNENILNEIKQKSFVELSNLINKKFYVLFQNMILLGSNINYYEDKNKIKQTSAFMYLMKYPFFQNIYDFVKENKININYEDYLDNNALSYLLENKKNIITISKNIYENAFHFLINNMKNELINKLNKEGKSIFGICLNNNYFDEANLMLKKFLNFKEIFYSEILFFILDKIKNDNLDNLENFFNYYRNDIDFNLFNLQNKRSLLHYIFLYLSGNDLDLYLFQQILKLCANLKINFSSKDIFNRNALYYFFLDENDNLKNIVSYEKFEYLLKNMVFKDLNSIDIFGNNLLDYAIQSNSIYCVELLIHHGVNLNINKNKNENSIFASALLNNN